VSEQSRKIKSYKPGSVICREGEPGQSAYIVVKGLVEVKCLKDGKDFTLAILGPGELFGEMSLIDDIPRVATVVALEETQLELIESQELRDNLALSPKNIQDLVKTLLNRFRALNKQLLFAEDNATASAFETFLDDQQQGEDENPFAIPASDVSMDTFFGDGPVLGDSSTKLTEEDPFADWSFPILEPTPPSQHTSHISGSDPFAFFGSTPATNQPEFMDQVQLTGELRQAINNGKLDLYLIPVFNLSNKAIVGYDAKVSWTKSNGETLDPDELNAFAEQTGLITSLQYWGLEKVALLIQALKAKQPDPPPYISYELSKRHFVSNSIIHKIDDLITTTPFDTACMCIEITEQPMINDPHTTGAIMEDLHEKGLRFFMDHFGTGYSSLSHIDRYPLAGLKIDEQFVSSMDNSKRAFRFTQAAIQMGHTFGLRVTAEGVATQAQVDMLMECGCSTAQGAFLGAPVPSDQI
jgi:EAL domain-containing protein (putative c-di-GMP-specific phosphodiesterase class I)/CRP-like cAMP-binding protein